MKVLKQVLIYFLLLSSAICNAKEIKINGVIYSTNRFEAAVRKVSEEQKNIIILPEVKIGNYSYPVTSISQGAFKSHLKIENIVIPNSVTLIGYEAFCNCGGLKYLTLPDKATVLISDPYFSKGAKKSPVEGCVNLIEIKGNTVERPNYFDTHLGYNIKEVPFFINPVVSSMPLDSNADSSPIMSSVTISAMESSALKTDSGPESEYEYDSKKKEISKEKVKKKESKNSKKLSNSSYSETQQSELDILQQMLNGNNEASDSSSQQASAKQTSPKKLSQKSIKTFVDNGKSVAGEYVGVGVLSKDNEIIERYNKISIRIKRIDRNNVGINVYENGDIPFFNSDIAYKVEKAPDGYYLTNSEIPSATIKIKDGENLQYIHPRLGIDDGIYKLSILVGKDNLAMKGSFAGSDNFSDYQEVDSEEVQLTVKTHIVAAGETFASIARKYNVNVDNLKEWNEISPKLPASSKPTKGTELLIYVNYRK